MKENKKKCFYSNLVNENVLIIEEIKNKEKYLELPFGAEISYFAGHPLSTAFPPLCGYIKMIILYDSNYQMIFKEMDVNDMYLITNEELKANPPYVLLCKLRNGSF